MAPCAIYHRDDPCSVASTVQLASTTVICFQNYLEGREALKQEYADSHP